MSLSDYGPPAYLASPGAPRRPGSGAATLIVDFGAGLTKAGCLQLDARPALVCPSELQRSRRNNADVVAAGNAIAADQGKALPRRLFEDFSAVEPRGLEDFCDYLFGELQAAPGDALAFTEPLGLSPRFREQSLELFFECYEFGCVLPCVDSIAASFAAVVEFAAPTALVVDAGHASVRVLPFLDSNLDTRAVRRLDAGLDAAKGALARLAGVKYGGFAGLFTSRVASSFFEREAWVARDYVQQQNFFRRAEHDAAVLRALDAAKRELAFAVPPAAAFLFSAAGSAPLAGAWKQDDFLLGLDAAELAALRPGVFVETRPAEEDVQRARAAAEAQAARRAETTRRVVEVFREKREAQRRGDEESLAAAEAQLAEAPDDAELLAQVRRLRLRLGLMTAAERDRERYSMLSRPDEELTPRELRVKRCQKMQLDRARARDAARRQREAERDDAEAARRQDPARFLAELLARRRLLRSKVKRLRAFKEDARPAQDAELRAVGDAGFDFAAFARELMEVSSDVETYESELQGLGAQIRGLQPAFDEEADNEEVFLARRFAAEEGAFVGADLARAAETLFRPALVGSAQKGLSECVIDIVEHYPAARQGALLGNVVVVGGGARLAGLLPRLAHDLERHFSARFPAGVRVRAADDAPVAAYRGIHRFLRDYCPAPAASRWFYTRAEYQEHGASLLKTCPIGNL